jgi:hypothetical protein
LLISKSTVIGVYLIGGLTLPLLLCAGLLSYIVLTSKPVDKGDYLSADDTANSEAISSEKNEKRLESSNLLSADENDLDGVDAYKHGWIHISQKSLNGTNWIAHAKRGELIYYL